MHLPGPVRGYNYHHACMMHSICVANAMKKMAAPEEYEITVLCTGDAANTLVELLKSISVTTGWGTGTSIRYPVDVRGDEIVWDTDHKKELESNGFKTEFFFDGDGADHILEIRQNGTKIKIANSQTTPEMEAETALCLSLMNRLAEELRKESIHVRLAFGFAQLIVDKLSKMSSPTARIALAKAKQISKALESIFKSVPKIHDQLSQVFPYVGGKRASWISRDEFWVRYAFLNKNAIPLTERGIRLVDSDMFDYLNMLGRKYGIPSMGTAIRVRGSIMKAMDLLYLFRDFGRYGPQFVLDYLKIPLDISSVLPQESMALMGQIMSFLVATVFTR